jgi:hypothetical protein
MYFSDERLRRRAYPSSDEGADVSDLYHPHFRDEIVES